MWRASYVLVSRSRLNHQGILKFLESRGTMKDSLKSLRFDSVSEP
jgi:hypothetical protein